MKTTQSALAIYRHYKEKYPEVKHYYGIIANYGLVNLAEIKGKGSEEYEMCRNILAMFPDKIKHPQYNFPSYRICGIAKARANYMNIVEADEQVRFYADELMTAPRSKEGILCMPSGSNDLIWIDTATAVTPFLLFAGLKLNNSDYIKEAVYQAVSMYDIFLDDKNGLLHQSRGFCGKNKISEDHWSRGNGWGILSMSELCRFLPDGHEDKAKCERYFKEHVEALIKYQSEDGMWRQEITLIEYDGLESYKETSGTGLILYAIGSGMESGLLDRAKYLPLFEKGIKGMVSKCVGKDFSISNCCPGCLCPGDGSIKAYLSYRKPYIDESHGAGPVIMALAEAYRNGITDI